MPAARLAANASRVRCDIRLRSISAAREKAKAMTSEASLLDNFCYALKNMPEMEKRPQELKGEIFDLLFNSAEIN